LWAKLSAAYIPTTNGGIAPSALATTAEPCRSGSATDEITASTQKVGACPRPRRITLEIGQSSSGADPNEPGMVHFTKTQRREALESFIVFESFCLCGYLIRYWF
jgi:hypothetical protein